MSLTATFAALSVSVQRLRARMSPALIPPRPALLHPIIGLTLTIFIAVGTADCVGPIAELTTTLTDYIIFVEASILAYWTYRSYADDLEQGKTRERCSKSSVWYTSRWPGVIATTCSHARALGMSLAELYMAVAFAVLAVQFVLGGSEHGFYKQLCCDADNVNSECANASYLWIVSMFGQAVSMSSFVIASAYSMLTAGLKQTIFIAFGVAASMTYGVLVVVGTVLGNAFLVSFLLLIVFSAPSLLLILGLSAYTASQTDIEAASHIRNGFGIILISVLLQVGKVSIHEYFNHNVSRVHETRQRIPDSFDL